MTQYLKEKETFYTQKIIGISTTTLEEQFANACKVESVQTLHTNINMIDLLIDE